MKNFSRFLLPAGIILGVVLIYVGYTGYSKSKQLRAFQTLAGSFFKQATALRIAYLNEIGIIHTQDIRDNNDLKDTAILLGIKQSLGLINQVETRYDSSSVQFIGKWQDSLSIWKQQHPSRDTDSLLLCLSKTLLANLEFFDSIRPAYRSYYETYIDLIDTLVFNNEKVTIREGRVTIMDKDLGMKVNALQIRFSTIVKNYNDVAERSKSTLTDRLRQNISCFRSEEMDIYLSLFEK